MCSLSFTKATIQTDRPARQAREIKSLFWTLVLLVCLEIAAVASAAVAYRGYSAVFEQHPLQLWTLGFAGPFLAQRSGITS